MAQQDQSTKTTTPDWRYCFLMPDIWQPVGGQAVLYDIANSLKQMEYNATLVHSGPWHRYPFAETQCEIFHLPELAGVNVRKRRLRDRIRRVMARLRERRTNPRADRFCATEQDVFLVPEFCYPEYAAVFPNARLLLVVQDPTAFLRAYGRDEKGLHQRFMSVIATSEVAVEAVRVLLDRVPHRVFLSVARPELEADHPKKMQIAYMPRKLGSQSARVKMALYQRRALKGVPIVAIEKMSNEERDRVLSESLIFLSFSNMEGFGLPPAEAMAAGCIVIGYTGVGAKEYFTPKTGFVIEHHDMLRFIQQIEDVVVAYQNNPAPLDTLRAAAAETITARYSVEHAQESLKEVWSALQTDLESERDTKKCL